MKNFIIDIRKNLLLRIASLNSVAIGVRIVSGLLTSKAIAIFIGTEGMALIGNLRDFLRSVQVFSTLGFGNGVIKYVSKFKNSAVDFSKTISTAFYVGLFATFLISIYCYIDAQSINAILFGSGNDYSFTIQFLALALPLFSINAFILAVINGLSEFKKLIYINICSQLLGLIITLFLIWKEQLTGALIAVVIVESVIILVTVIVAKGQRNILKLISLKQVELNSLKKLGTYSFMSLFTALTLPLVMVAIRNYIIDTQGQHEAGLWEAMNRISGYYLLFVSTLMTVYLLPRFSEIENKQEFRKEVFSFYKTIMPIFGFGLVVIYFLRHFIIKIVFTEEFYEVENLFFWQLLGDFIKVFSIVIAYQFLAKRMLWYYIITEALSMSVLYFASIYFIDLYGAKGATIAHFVDYVFYLMLMFMIFRKHLFGDLDTNKPISN